MVLQHLITALSNLFIIVADGIQNVKVNLRTQIIVRRFDGSRYRLYRGQLFLRRACLYAIFIAISEFCREIISYYDR